MGIVLDMVGSLGVLGQPHPAPPHHKAAPYLRHLHGMRGTYAESIAHGIIKHTRLANLSREAPSIGKARYIPPFSVVTYAPAYMVWYEDV